MKPKKFVRYSYQSGLGSIDDALHLSYETRTIALRCRRSDDVAGYKVGPLLRLEITVTEVNDASH